MCALAQADLPHVSGWFCMAMCLWAPCEDALYVQAQAQSIGLE